MPAPANTSRPDLLGEIIWILDTTLDRLPPDIEHERFEAILRLTGKALTNIDQSRYITGKEWGMNHGCAGCVDRATAELSQNKPMRCTLVLITDMQPGSWEEMQRSIIPTPGVEVRHFTVAELSA